MIQKGRSFGDSTSAEHDHQYPTDLTAGDYRTGYWMFDGSSDVQ